MTFEEILTELRDVVAEGQRVPSYDVADTRTLVEGIDRLTRNNAAMVRHLDALEDPDVADDEVVHLRARVAALESAGHLLLTAARGLTYTWETTSSDHKMWDAWSKVGPARTAWMNALRSGGDPT